MTGWSIRISSISLEAKLAHIPARIIRVEKEGHLIVHRDPDLIIAELRALLAQL